MEGSDYGIDYASFLLFLSLFCVYISCRMTIWYTVLKYQWKTVSSFCTHTSFSCVTTNVVTNDNMFQVCVNSTHLKEVIVKLSQFLCGTSSPGDLAFQNATSCGDTVNSSAFRNAASLYHFKSVMPPALSHCLIKFSVANNYTCAKMLIQTPKLFKSK